MKILMKEITQHLTPKALTNTYHDWTIVNPLLFARKLNRLLKTKEVRREAHRCALAFDAIKRWDALEHYNFDIYPKATQPYEGEEFLYPEQVSTLLWDCDLGPGRPPNYHRFVIPSGCHWRAPLSLMLARKLMPDLDWIVVSAEKHTMICCPEQQLIFDETYFAMGVSAQSALHTVFGSDLSSTDYEIFEEEYPFSRHTVEIIHIWDLIDSKPEADRLDLCRGLGQHLDEMRANEEVSAAAIKRELVAA